MASLQQKGNGWYCQFMYHGKRHTISVGPVSHEEAEAKASHVDYLLLRLKQRLTTVPTGVSIVDYVQFDGKTEQVPQTSEKIALDAFRDQYLNVHRESLEISTVKGIEQHFGHLTRHLGDKFPIAEITLADLQGYVDKRAKAKGRNGRKLSGGTIAKELISLRTAWNWGERMKLVTGKFPNKGLRFPKTTEKPPFMTREEIERRIQTSRLTKAEIADLWDCLYLSVSETTELLEYVEQKNAQPFVYPLFCFVFHTGCRRSEALRTKIADVDFVGGVVTIHEKKRVRGKLTTRRVPLSAFLTGVLRAWLAVHPGGEYLFCQSPKVIRSKTRKGIIKPLTNDEASDHFDRALADSKWDVVKGWHVARHGFVSALASKGIDQRLIDDFVGHTSEEMRRRYRHLSPQVKQNAVTSVFG